MKVIGITGYGKSGKTTLILKLLEELSKKGHSVAVIKHVPGSIDFPNTDTSKFRKLASFSSAVSPEESEIIVKGKRHIEDILKYCDSDIVLIEGFKKEKSFPRIVCIKDEDEKSALFDGLELCTAGFNEDIVDFNISKEGHIKRLADIVIERSFKLPDLNCGHCGYDSCYELAMEIVNGSKSTAHCVSLNPPISIKIDGQGFALNPFMSDLFKNSFLAMISSLKGFKKGQIEITIP